MRKVFVSAFVLVFLAIAAQAPASIVFQDDFESGAMAPNWTNISGSVDISNAQNKVPAGGQYSALIDVSTDGAYHNLGTEVPGPSTFSYWLYDDTQTRAWAEVRGYGGAGYPDGTMVHLAAIGKYNSVTMPGETYDSTKYQGRISLTPTSNLWFNLNGPGAPSRSPGWHEFAIERLADNTTLNFYVDGILSRTITGATADSWDSVLLTSVRAGTTAGNAWLDGVQVTNTLIPEPAGLGLLGMVLAGLLARRRK